MRDQRVLVTGGAGFIGSNLANHLSEDNEVIVVDDYTLGTESNLERAVEFHERSVLDPDLPTDVDVVFHFAALSSYGMCEAEPRRSMRVNVEGFVNVAEQAHLDGCSRIVYASTSSLYGTRPEPTPETAEVRTNTAYEASIRARERYAEYVSAHHDVSMAGLRLFSVYQGYGGAEGHKGGYANVIAQFADDIANDRSPKLYGDGTQTRDFVHVDDVVRAIEAVATARLEGIYNVGTGERHSFDRVVELLNDELGTDVEPRYVENPIPQSAYVHDTCADYSKLCEATGWVPEIDLERGIERVCATYRSQR